MFVVYGYQGAEEDADKLRLTDKLLQAVLAEAQVVCIGQPMLIAGDFNADPAVIPCLAKGMSAGRYVDLALCPLSWCWCPRLILHVHSIVMMAPVLVGDFLCWTVQMLLLLPRSVLLLTGGLLPHFSVLARFRIDAWMADVSCPVACQPLLPACWVDTPDRSSSSSSRLVQDVWDVYRDVLGVVPDAGCSCLEGCCI